MPESIPIEDLELSVRAYNVLNRAGIRMAEELCSMTEADLLDLRNLGAAGIEDIKANLARVGLRLKGR